MGPRAASVNAGNGGGGGRLSIMLSAGGGVLPGGGVGGRTYRGRGRGRRRAAVRGLGLLHGSPLVFGAKAAVGLLFLGRGARSARLHRCCENAMSCVDGRLALSGGPCLVGGPRHRCVVSCAVCTRCVTARGSVGVRLWLFCERGQEFGLTATSAAAAARRQRLAAAERVWCVLSTGARWLLVSYMPLAHVLCRL